MTAVFGQDSTKSDLSRHSAQIMLTKAAVDSGMA